MTQNTYGYRTLYVAALLLMFVALGSCRSRATRSTKSSQKTATTATVTAQQVLDHADSALARVAAIDEESPVVDQPPFGRDPALGQPVTPWGMPYVPRPDLSGYGEFEAALGQYNARNFDAALSIFSRMVISGRPPELVPNAYYWMGESFYAMGRYAEAQQYFEYTTRVGPEYKREIALYKLALSSHLLGNEQAASTYYQRLRADYPSTKFAARLRKQGVK